MEEIDESDDGEYCVNPEVVPNKLARKRRQNPEKWKKNVRRKLRWKNETKVVSLHANILLETRSVMSNQLKLVSFTISTNNIKVL